MTKIKFTPIKLQEEILKLHGWTETDGPKNDYDGPCEWEVLLIPPMDIDRFNFPPKGKIGRGFFYNGRKDIDYCNNLEAAWGLVIEMSLEMPVTFGVHGDNNSVMRHSTPDDYVLSGAPTMPLAITIAYYQFKTGNSVELVMP